LREFAEERLDKVARLAEQLGLPHAAVSGADRPARRQLP
jgi:hypothetical protein